jgi:hypothetical protein
VSVVSHIPSPVHCAIPVPCVVSPCLPLSCVHGPCSSFPVLTSLVPPSFPLFGPCRLSCPCAWCAPSPFLSPSWSWSLHPPIHPASSCLQWRWGVLGCGSGCSPRASHPCCASLPHASGPIIPSSSLVLPISTPRAVAHGGGSGCCCAGRRGRHSATGRGQWQHGGVTGAYLAGIPLQGSPSALHTLFIIHMSTLFVRHCCSVLHLLSYVLCMLSYIVCTLLYTICLHLYVFVVRMLSSVQSFVRCCMLFIVLRMLLYIVRTLSYTVCLCSYIIVHTSSYIVHCPLSFVRRSCGNVPRNILENSLLVKDKKDERYKKTHLGPK